MRAQGPGTGQGPGTAAGVVSVVVPESTVEHLGDIGVAPHTNHLILVRPQFTGTTPGGETPASLACVYRTTSPLASGCTISGSTTNASGGSGIIAIVDAYHYPTAINDFYLFSKQFNLPCTSGGSPSTSATVGCPDQFSVVYVTNNGRAPRTNCGWAQEAALDIEWAHAMAPNAKIVLFEAASNFYSDLFRAVDTASQYISTHGGNGEVSMSWGGSEFSSEGSYDSHFKTPGVSYLAASGDTGGKVLYPSASPNVISAGGTTIHRDGTTGNFTGETGWSGSGGGPSAVEPVPSYQSANAQVSALVKTKRGTPDFSFDSDPSSGVSVYDSTPCQGFSGWLVFGGTSVAAPALAGILNLAGNANGGTGSGGEQSAIYTNLGSANFTDITSGQAGSFNAAAGWDFVTGVGTNVGLSGK